MALISPTLSSPVSIKPIGLTNSTIGASAATLTRLPVGIEGIIPVGCFPAAPVPFKMAMSHASAIALAILRLTYSSRLITLSCNK
jgi:hypothetical protein